jgi:hypothetical protein
MYSIYRSISFPIFVYCIMGKAGPCHELPQGLPCGVAIRVALIGAHSAYSSNFDDAASLDIWSVSRYGQITTNEYSVESGVPFHSSCQTA